jgi:hypothetical protein
MATKTLADRLYDVPTGPQFHAILAALVGREPQTTAAYVGKATVTSDGYAMCAFRDGDGDCHHGAFVGSMADIERNIDGVAQHLELAGPELAELWALLDGWIATDYRSVRRSTPFEKAQADYTASGN